mgnify:CR=1 FL=1
MRSPQAQQRYWARSFVAWQYFSRAQPNAAHDALAALEARGSLQGGLITQNVDGLHQQAGHANCLDLHGRIDEVECLECGAATPRAELQQRLEAANPSFAPRLRALAATSTSFSAVRADGDMELSAEETRTFVVQRCTSCRGPLKPAVTFFGGSVPRAATEAAFAAVDAADSVLVVGSSMQVYSAFRLARRAHERGLPIAILNVGPTRADDLAALHIHADAAELLPGVIDEVTG